MIGRGSGLTRVERARLERRARAQAHLERRRGSARSRHPSRAARGVWFGLWMALGALIGPALLGAAVRDGARLEAIHVNGTARLSPEQIAAATGLARGAAPGEVDAAQVEARLAELPWIARARAVWLPSGALVVGIDERLPVARLRAGQSGGLVDAAGTPFPPAEAGAGSELPLLVLAAPFRFGETDPRLVAALEILQALPGHGLNAPEEIRLAADGDPEGFSLRLRGLGARVLLGRDAPASRLGDLARLLAAGRPEVAQAGTLDLRFADRAVLRDTPSPTGTAQAAAPGGRPTPSTGG